MKATLALWGLVLGLPLATWAADNSVSPLENSLARGPGLQPIATETTPAAASGAAPGTSGLPLATAGHLYVRVLEGHCPRRVDLWGVGPQKNPMHLGRFEGSVRAAPPRHVGSFQEGQSLYMWHETTDPATGLRESADVNDPRAFKVEMDPRGGYRVEVRASAAVAPDDPPW